ncbi:MAG: flavin reductase family protein [Hyphomicrobiales bacterium]
MTDTVLRQRFLEGMSRGATFVSVITTDGPAGRYGVTVSSMTPVAADGPAPSLLVCIHQRSPVVAAVLGNGRFCANLLHESQQEVAHIFSGRSKDEPLRRFEHVAWTAGSGGQPVLTGATAVFSCVLKTSMLWETHHIMVGEVCDVQLSDQPQALLYGQRAYRRAVDLS